MLSALPKTTLPQLGRLRHGLQPLPAERVWSTRSNAWRTYSKSHWSLMAMLMGPGLKKKEHQNGRRPVDSCTPWKLEKIIVEELQTTREARNQQAKQMTSCNSPHSTYHPNPCQPLKKVPPLPSSASLPHSHAEPKEWRGLSPPCPSICWVVSLPNMQSSPTRSDITFFIEDPYKPSFATSWEGGPSNSYLLCISRLPYFFVVFAKGGMNILPSAGRILLSTIPIGNLL